MTSVRVVDSDSGDVGPFEMLDNVGHDSRLPHIARDCAKKILVHFGAEFVACGCRADCSDFVHLEKTSYQNSACRVVRAYQSNHWLRS